MPPPRILDPRSVPVIGTDSHLPPIAPQRLAAEALRERFRAPPAWEPEFAGDGARFHAERAPATAAVLVPLVARGGALSVLLTRRTEHLRDHAGQISFPGGRSEPGDADATATALREAHEEVGLEPASAEVIGQLPAYATVTSFVVTPVVALLAPPLALRLDEHEVAEAFEVPLAFVMNPAHHRRHQFAWEGGTRSFLSMPWRTPGHAGESGREYFIWGATAAMLRNLYRFIAA